MKYYSILFFALFTFSALAQTDSFKSDILDLKVYYQIPGLSYAVIQGNEVISTQYFGMADIEKGRKISNETLFPVASLTKIYSGIMIQKLASEGKLNLDDSITSYFPNSNFDDSIQVRHILSHTSQGSEIGKHFIYSNRYSLLTKIIEVASGMSFSDYFNKVFIENGALKNTFLYEDELTKNPDLAQPYNLEEGAVPGNYDSGYSSSAGVVTTLDDFIIFHKMLVNHELLSNMEFENLTRPAYEGSPYGHGIFNQKIYNREVIWAYGQYDSYASLYVYIPEEELAFIVFANNNLMNDAARLIYGDLRYSLIAQAFFSKYFEPNNEQDQLKAKALSASFMARYDSEEFNKARGYLFELNKNHPDHSKKPSLSHIHSMNFLKTVAFYKDLGTVQEYDKSIESQAKALLMQNPENPYALIYLAYLYESTGFDDDARRLYTKIAQLPNFSPNWYTREALRWLDVN